MTYIYLIMKKSLLFCALLTLLPTFAQTQWQKLSATKATDFGLTYNLPKTLLYADIEFTKTELKAAPYYRYAEKLLGVSNPIIQDSVYFSLDKATVYATSTVDRHSASMVRLESKAIVPYIVLNSEGILCAVNGNPDSNLYAKIVPLPSNYIVKQAIANSQLSLTEETLASGSTAKMAEMAAKQIFRLRESRLDLLSGDADQRPKDGEGIKVLLDELDKQEKALTALFLGTTQVEKQFARIKITPADTDLNHYVLFRFSKHFGFLSSDDLSGEPVYLDIKATDRKEYLPADPKAKPSDVKGLAYLIPGKGAVKVSYGAKSLFDAEFTFTQFGITANFPVDLFTRKKSPAKVTLHPETGAVLNLVQ